MKLQKGAEISLHDGYTYFVVFSKVTTPKQKAPWIQQVKFTLTGYRHGNLVEKTFTSPGKLYVDGDYRTPAYIHAFVSQVNVTVYGISFTLAASAAPYNQLYIDGMKKTVTQSALGNIFHRTDITKFPQFEPGDNNISFSEGVSEVTVSYYPIFL
jgi:phage-related protein